MELNISWRKDNFVVYLKNNLGVFFLSVTMTGYIYHKHLFISIHFLHIQIDFSSLKQQKTT